MEFCFTGWRDYFRRNQSAVKELNCKYDQLSETERRVICSSVQMYKFRPQYNTTNLRIF